MTFSEAIDFRSAYGAYGGDTDLQNSVTGDDAEDADEATVDASLSVGNSDCRSDSPEGWRDYAPPTDEPPPGNQAGYKHWLIEGQRNRMERTAAIASESHRESTPGNGLKRRFEGNDDDEEIQEQSGDEEALEVYDTRVGKRRRVEN
jgi:hypothetical protein